MPKRDDIPLARKIFLLPWAAQDSSAIAAPRTHPLQGPFEVRACWNGWEDPIAGIPRHRRFGRADTLQSESTEIERLQSGPIFPTLLWRAVPNVLALASLVIVGIVETYYGGPLGTTPLRS